MLILPEARLEQAHHVTDLSPDDRAVLIWLIEAEIKNELQGCYSDISDRVYHHPLAPGYSSTTLKRILSQSYNHYVVSSAEKSDTLRFGSAFHKYRLEPQNFLRDYVVCPVDHKGSAEYKKAVRENPLKDVITISDFRCIEKMSRKVYQHPRAAELFEGAEFELAWWSKDEETGLWKKCKTDVYPRRYRIINDLKSCMSAAKDAFERDAKKFMYRVSAGFYCEVVEDVTGLPHEDFRFTASEKVDPWELAVHQTHEDSLVRGRDESRRALREIKRIHDGGPDAWRGYPLNVEKILI